MTAKDFRTIATTLRMSKPAVSVFPSGLATPEDAAAMRTWVALCKNFANTLASDNPRFATEKFLAACECPL